MRPLPRKQTVMTERSTFSLQMLAPRHWPSWIGLGLLRLSVALPYQVQLRLGRTLGNLLWHLAGRHRRIVLTNLRLCFPQKSETDCQALAREHFQALGISLFEIALSWWASDARLRPLLSTQGYEHIEQALQTGKGVILLTAHFTTLEISARLMSMLRPIDVTYRAGDENPIGTHLRGQRDKLYEEAIPKENVRGVIRRLKENKIIWYAPDQSFGGTNRVFATFFGIPAASNPATSRFARISGARVVPFFARRRERDYGYELIFLPALEDFPTADLTADTQRINHVFEELIARAPEQYFWVHKRFKHGPSGQESPY